MKIKLGATTWRDLEIGTLPRDLLHTTAAALFVGI
jgi:hypothetical protein